MAKAVLSQSGNAAALVRSVGDPSLAPSLSSEADSRKNRFRSSSMYGITCTSDGRGWYVCLIRQKVTYAKTFTFSVYGGKDAALVHARAWRDETAKTHPPVPRQAEADKIRRNNKSGVVGVVALKNAQGKVTGWIAQTYLGPGNHVSKYFSLSRFGEDEAKRLAIAERQKQLGQMAGLRRVHPAEELVRYAPNREIKPAPERVAHSDRLLASNTTGIVGVTLEKDKTGRARRWIATTRVDDKQLSKSFSVLIHGYEEAKALATAARTEQLRLKEISRLQTKNSN